MTGSSVIVSVPILHYYRMAHWFCATSGGYEYWINTQKMSEWWLRVAESTNNNKWEVWTYPFIKGK